MDVNRDTTVTGVWDLQGKILNISAKITGPCIIKGAIINANIYLEIFDTTVTLQSCRTPKFSTSWFGASPLKPDNSVYLQKSITTCIANDMDLWCAESYTILQSLLAFKIVGGRYVGFGLNFYGDGDHWNQRQTITYKGTGFAYGVQVAKGGSFRGIGLVGLNMQGSGIMVDYDNTKNASGSTGFTVENCYVGYFDINFNISPTGAPWNGDIIKLNNIHSGKCRVAVRSGQAQNKGNEINGFYSWDSCKIAFQIMNGNWIITGGNIANYCAQMLDVTVSGWNTFSIHGIYAERLLSLGNISAYTSVYVPPVNLQDMNIRFIPGPQVLFSTNSYKVRISNSTLWFYNGRCCEKMNFAGPWIWDNNDCGYCEINDKDIQYIVPTKLNQITLR